VNDLIIVDSNKFAINFLQSCCFKDFFLLEFFFLTFASRNFIQSFSKHLDIRSALREDRLFLDEVLVKFNNIEVAQSFVAVYV